MKKALLAAAAVLLAPLAARAACSSFPLYLGLNPDLYATDTVSDANRDLRVSQVKAAGANFLFFSPRWSELEPTSGSYVDTPFTQAVQRAAAHGMPLLVNFKVIDTGTRTMPSDLASDQFDDVAVQAAFRNMLAHFIPLIQSNGAQAPWIVLGNEVNIYLNNYPGEVAAYETLYATGAAKVKELLPSSQVSVTLTANAFIQPFTFDLQAMTDFFSVTYYPLNSDYSVRPDSATTQLAQMADTATVAGKGILFQEVGFPSGAANSSSEALQAKFYSDVFNGLLARTDVFIGANFMMLADLSLSSATAQAAFYGNPGDAAFISYLQTIGVVTEAGAAKDAWSVFSARAAGCGGAGGGGEEDLVPYPSPWRAAAHQGQPMRFSRLPETGRLLILTLTGDRVAEIPIEAGQAAWDLKDDNGRPVPSGTYVAVEKDGASRGAFSVVR